MSYILYISYPSYKQVNGQQEDGKTTESNTEKEPSPYTEPVLEGLEVTKQFLNGVFLGVNGEILGHRLVQRLQFLQHGVQQGMLVFPRGAEVVNRSQGE